MIGLIISFIIGFLVKTVDNAEEHGLKMNRLLKIILGLVYGILLGWLVSFVPIPGFWIGIIIGLIVSGKIDSESHYAGMVGIVLSLLFFGFPAINWWIVLITMIICYAEEWVNDEIVDKKKVIGFLAKLLSLRPLLEITAAILAVIYLDINIFLLLLFFDIGYFIAKARR